ncbi:MAG: hypothetical protein ACJ763_00795 [Bdellovibrionia bacterium]
MKKLSSAALGAGFLLLAHSAWTAELSNQDLGEISLAPRKAFDWGGTLSAEAAGYLYSPRTKTEDVYSTLIARPYAHLEGSWVEMRAGLEAIAMAPLSKQDSTQAYIEMPEGYISTSSKIEVAKISLGRKLEDWNHLDEEWRLGIWQPRYRWDYLRPDTVALTGITVEVERPLFKAVIFGTPISIPERGVPISNDNGQLISDSPWFISPPRKIQVMDRDTPLKYDLQIPSMSKLLLHPAGSAMVRIGDKMGPWIAGGYAYKPMNQLLLSYQGQLVVDGNRSTVDVADVPVAPRVVYHHLISAEAGFNHEIVSGWISSLIDRPGHDYGPELTRTWTEQTVTRAISISPTLQFHITDQKENQMKAALSYLYQDGGNGPDVSGDGNALLGGQSVFESRYPYQSALKAGGELEMPGLLSTIGIHNSGTVVVASSLLYDTKNHGSILSMDFKYLPSTRWEIGLGADVLGSQDPKGGAGSNETPNDFIGRYQANDRVRAGVRYVF